VSGSSFGLDRLSGGARLALIGGAVLAVVAVIAAIVLLL
jgi:hypothetical protein